jgi:hypothetical protein
MKVKNGKALVAWAALAGASALTPHVSGAIIDLTTNQTGTANGALFQRADFRPAGTGFINSFVRLQTNNAVEQGYNTSGRPVPFDENNSPQFTRNITYGQVPTVTFNGTDYKEFILDINQTNSNPLLSLDQLRIFTSPNGSQTTTDVSSLGTERYNLDAGGDNTVLLDYSLNSGSGQGDMFLMVPVSAFGNASASDFVYLYSLFGEHNPNNAGFEEWAIRETAIPLPPAAWAGFIGLAAVGVRYSLRRRLPV